MRPRRALRIEGSVEFEIPFATLRKGDGFKLFESNGEALNFGDIFRADSDAYVDTTVGVWVVKATPLIFGNRLGSYTISSFDG